MKNFMNAWCMNALSIRYLLHILGNLLQSGIVSEIYIVKYLLSTYRLSKCIPKKPANYFTLRRKRGLGSQCMDIMWQKMENCNDAYHKYMKVGIFKGQFEKQESRKPKIMVFDNASQHSRQLTKTLNKDSMKVDTYDSLLKNNI